MSCVFINHPLETWTPTSSGALATIIWECCQIAKVEGRRPWVITRSSDVERFPWAQTITIAPPEITENPLVIKAYRAERKFTGWRHLRHEAYASKVAKAISKGLSGLPFVLINDPEMTVYLRQKFPDATILHWFQNQLESTARFRQAYKESDVITTACSDFTSNWVKEYYDLETVTTVYNAVDSEQFFPRNSAEQGNIPTISYVGRTGIEKAPDVYLSAAVKLSETTQNFKLLMIGSNHWDRFELDDYQTTLQALVDVLKSRGIEVSRPGHIGRAQLPAVLRQADIHVVPSRWDEPFGMTTVEGMASGCAVVASNTGGTPEIVANCGFLFERDSVDGLACHLEKLVCDENLRRVYAQKARNRALTFNWQNTWRTIHDLIA